MSLQFIAPETKSLGIKIIKEFSVNAEFVLKTLKRLENPVFQEEQMMKNLQWRLEDEKLHLKKPRNVVKAAAAKDGSQSTVASPTAAVGKEKVGKKKKTGSKWN